MRFGTIALVGRTNVRKIDPDECGARRALAITSPLPQTTRDTVLGIAHKDGVQMALLDTPGIHQPKSELGRRMNDTAKDTLRQAAVVLMVTDIFPQTAPCSQRGRTEARRRGEQEEHGCVLATSICWTSCAKRSVPVILAINKSTSSATSRRSCRCWLPTRRRACSRK